MQQANWDSLLRVIATRANLETVNLLGSYLAGERNAPKLERSQIGSIRTRQWQTLMQSIPSMKLKELEVVLFWVDEDDQENELVPGTVRQELLHAVKNNFSLRSVKARILDQIVDEEFILFERTRSHWHSTPTATSFWISGSKETGRQSQGKKGTRVSSAEASISLHVTCSASITVAFSLVCCRLLVLLLLISCHDRVLPKSRLRSCSLNAVGCTSIGPAFSLCSGSPARRWLPLDAQHSTLALRLLRQCSRH